MIGRPPRWAWALLLLAAGAANATPDASDFARCLTRAGVTYYYASWCPHCAAQDRMFGNAVRHLRRVDCTRGCPGVASLPLWRFADGTQHAGVATFSVLAARTRCRLGPPEERDPGAGVKIIDVR